MLMLILYFLRFLEHLKIGDIINSDEQCRKDTETQDPLKAFFDILVA